MTIKGDFGLYCLHLILIVSCAMPVAFEITFFEKLSNYTSC